MRFLRRRDRSTARLTAPGSASTRRPADVDRGPHRRVDALITELTLLAERQDAAGAELACQNLDAALATCDDATLAADGQDLLAQVVVPGRGVAHGGRHLPLAS